MGGFGSGRRSERPDVEGCPRLELPRLRREGYLKPSCKTTGVWSWTCGGQPAGSVGLVCAANPNGLSELVVSFTIDSKPVEQHIRLEGLPMRFGGWRWFAICPITGRRCTTLVLTSGTDWFASVKAKGLPYASQSETAMARAHRRIAKAEERLKRLSKFARVETRAQLWHQIDQAQAVVDAGFIMITEKFNGIPGASLTAAARLRKRDVKIDRPSLVTKTKIARYHAARRTAFPVCESS